MYHHALYDDGTMITDRERETALALLARSRGVSTQGSQIGG